MERRGLLLGHEQQLLEGEGIQGVRRDRSLLTYEIARLIALPDKGRQRRRQRNPRNTRHLFRVQ